MKTVFDKLRKETEPEDIINRNLPNCKAKSTRTRRKRLNSSNYTKCHIHIIDISEGEERREP